MEILEKGGKPDVFAYNAVISGFCKANRIESAEKVLDRMKRKGFSQDVVTYNIIMIGTFCSQGKIDLASKVFEELLRDNNCKPTLITCMILIEAHILEGGIDEGLKLLDEMLSRGIEPDTFTYIVRGLAKEGKVNQAFELVRTLNSRGLKDMKEKGLSLDACCYDPLIAASCREGKLDMAIMFMDYMISDGFCQILTIH
ncbi:PENTATRICOPEPTIDE (PPR) REPEAT PROTEIN [Salix koriyanagi]|uniref:PENTATRICOPEPTIDE (PPR) REPEAT PROTEIN n=1 Tax=Salix koriyanagi TaxID=2511006 RepID=A0A9Q1A7Y8_9ROSI|nr:PENTATRICOPEPTIDE (PPR) REPEAT PROTEIN [Salix koriyanagi]